MAASAGPAPWSEGFRRTSKSTLKKQGVRWSLGKPADYESGNYFPGGSGGYAQRDDWDKKPKKPKTRRIKLYSGKYVEVPVDDYQDFIGHFASPPSDPDSEIGQYIENAWEGPKQEVNGIGHIYDITYSPRYQMMWVGFVTDGAVVVFFRVPKEVFSELKYLAESGTTAISPVDGEQRHVLGMRFWDIVRIRGQRTGSRYKYEYAIEGTYEPKGGGTRQRAGQAYEQEVKGTALGKADAVDYKEDLKDFVGLMSTANQTKFMNMFKTSSAKQLYKFLMDHTPPGTMPTEEELMDPNF